MLQSQTYPSKNITVFLYIIVNVSLDPFDLNTLNTHELMSYETIPFTRNDNIYPTLLYL